MSMSHRNRLLMHSLAFVVWVLLSTATLAGEVVVIVNPSVGINSLTKEQVMQLFMLKEKNLPNDSPVRPVTPNAGATTRQLFESRVLERNPMQLRAYWTRLLFTGRGKIPEAMESNVQIKEKVAANPDVIGYIDSGLLDSSVVSVYTVK